MNRTLEASIATNHYFDNRLKIHAVKLLPGEYYVTRKNMVLITTLGSCVAVCLRDRNSGIGGMNHFMLPGNGSKMSGWSDSSARYGIQAMDVLINQLISLGAKKGHLDSKLFGGGAVMKGMNFSNIGVRNANFGLEYLKQEGIPILAQDLFAVFPRKIYFFPATGKVLVKRLVNLRNDTIFSRERHYRSYLENSNTDNETEQFSKIWDHPSHLTGE